MAAFNVCTRRSAVVAAVALALGRDMALGASLCAQKCKKQESKKRRQKCLSQCQKRQAATVTPPQPVQMNGTGSGISASFYLSAGRYISTAYITTTDTDNFIISLHGPNSDWDLAVNEIPQYPGAYQYQRVVEPRYSGTHFLEIEEASGTWTIVFTPA